MDNIHQPPSRDNIKSITLRQLLGPFMLLGFGIGVSLITFLYEIIVKLISRKKNVKM